MCWLILCQFDTVILEEGTSIEKQMPPSDLHVGKPAAHFLYWYWRAPFAVDNATSRLVVQGAIKAGWISHEEQARNQPSSTASASYLEFLPWLPLMMDHDVEISAKQTLSSPYAFDHDVHHSNSNP